MFRWLHRLWEDHYYLAREIWRNYFAHLPRILHPLPLIFSAVAGLLFGANGQLHEVYLSLMQGADWLRLLYGFVTIAVISWALFTSNIALTLHHITAHYASVSNLYLDPRLVWTRDLLALCCAAGPFVGLSAGIWLAGREAVAVRRDIDKLDARALEFSPAVDMTPYLVLSVMMAMVLLALFLRVRRRRRLAPYSAMFMAGGVALVTVSLVLAGPERLLVVTKMFGPLAMMGAQFILVLVMAACIALFPKPLRRTIYAIVVVAAAYSLWPGAPITASEPPATGELRLEVTKAFDHWLKGRDADIARFKDAKHGYPVFLVAAQGGGIVATTAAATFLARLQDACPGFLKHTFLISGVSGGAVGAALFDALARDRPAGTEPACLGKTQAAAGNSLSALVTAITTQDHLSPVLGLLVPGLVGGLIDDVLDNLPGVRARFFHVTVQTRASVLEDSLVCALANRAACPAAKTLSVLRQPFDEHWKRSPSGPALILNTTRAETGTTVAFSPFSLAGLGGSDIAAFSDAPFYLARSDNKSRLVTAAVASARFPGVMPPFVLWGKDTQSNFVDGGYADNSGVATAGAIYQVLKSKVDAEKLKIDLRLIVLTGDEDREQASRVAGSSTLLDIRVPLEALFNVRAGLGSREVVRALNQFADKPDDADQLPRVALIRFKTPFLGWTISRATNDFVTTMVAPEGRCIGGEKQREELLKGMPRDSLERIIHDNKCRILAIEALMSPPS